MWSSIGSLGATTVRWRHH